jgi:hypothetical protein
MAAKYRRVLTVPGRRYGSARPDELRQRVYGSVILFGCVISVIEAVARLTFPGN